MLWPIEISTALKGRRGINGGREISMKIEAPDGPTAVFASMLRFKLRKNEMLHVIHIGPPSANRRSHPRKTRR